MKVKVNIHELIEENATYTGQLQVSAQIDLEDLFDSIPEEQEIDVHDLLAERHAIGLIWDTEQVRMRHEHLTEEQAWEVLQECERHYKGEEGLTWDDICEVVTELYPDPEEVMRPIRISRCDEALQAYKDDDRNANLVDLLADAMLWCEAHEVSFEQCLDTATMHFSHETKTK